MVGTLAKVHSLGSFTDSPPFSAIIDYGNNTAEIVRVTAINVGESSLTIERVSPMPCRHIAGALIYSCLSVDAVNIATRMAVDEASYATPTVILAANGVGGGDRQVTILVICNEALGGTVPPVYEIGETGDADKFAGDLSALTAGSSKVIYGTLTEACDLIVTVTQGTGDPTGNFSASATVYTPPSPPSYPLPEPV